MDRDSLRNSYYRGRALLRRLRKAVRTPQRPIEAEMQRPWFRAGLRPVDDHRRRRKRRPVRELGARGVSRGHLLSFEPLPDCCRVLRDRFAGDDRFEAFECALGAAAGKAVSLPQRVLARVVVTRDGEYASRSVPPHRGSTEIEVEVQTLNAVLASRTLAEPMLLKLDVQGFEAQALARWGTATLARGRGSSCSSSALVRLYEAEPLFDDVLPFFAVTRSSGL